MPTQEALGHLWLRLPRWSVALTVVPLTVLCLQGVDMTDGLSQGALLSWPSSLSSTTCSTQRCFGAGPLLGNQQWRMSLLPSPGHLPSYLQLSHLLQTSSALCAHHCWCLCSSGLHSAWVGRCPSSTPCQGLRRCRPPPYRDLRPTEHLSHD